MKARIDKDGNILLERQGTLRAQYCPFVTRYKFSGLEKCGEWCPHFGVMPTNPGFTISLCHGTTLVASEVSYEQ